VRRDAAEMQVHHGPGTLNLHLDAGGGPGADPGRARGPVHRIDKLCGIHDSTSTASRTVVRFDAA